MLFLLWFSALARCSFEMDLGVPCMMYACISELSCWIVSVGICNTVPGYTIFEIILVFTMYALVKIVVCSRE